MPLIETVDLWKSYVMGEEEIHALRGVSIQIERGEYVAIMGPSGSGKSTLLMVIAGFEQPSSGDIRMGRRSIVDLPPERRCCARDR